jgi:DNA-binding XRE family transcriptional regulator
MILNRYHKPKPARMPPRPRLRGRAAFLVIFGDKVRRYRIAQGRTQKEFAKKIGVHRTYLTEIELGARNPTLIIIIKIARACQVSVGQLLRNI